MDTKTLNDKTSRYIFRSAEPEIRNMNFYQSLDDIETITDGLSHTFVEIEYHANDLTDKTRYIEKQLKMEKMECYALSKPIDSHLAKYRPEDLTLILMLWICDETV